jgi:hypothetical protein
MATLINIGSETESTVCFQISLVNESNSAMRVEGQNVRIYYNSEKLKFNKVFMDGMMPLTSYDFDLHMNKTGLSRDDVNQIVFDDNMGFLNFSVTAKDVIKDQSIVEFGNAIHAQSICFNKTSDEANISDVVLAKNGVTERYSKAFAVVEASPVNDEILLPMILLEVDQARVLAGLND